MPEYISINEIPEHGNESGKKYAWIEEVLATPPGCAYEVISEKGHKTVASSVRYFLRKRQPQGPLRMVCRGSRVFVVNDSPVMGEDQA
ncbi:hypothetical protein LCGC14_2493620 [marine sediment metagenome]|uniref:Uncharacterized protein n=1 Tax=marine sediment metagenome TaxID=412755 RepID=A0A0F9BRY2_9ZZZZ